jgi:hypothetical protein
LADLAKLAFPNERIALVTTSSEDKLKQDLSDTFKEYDRFRSILIAGHSDELELQLTSGNVGCSWRAVGQWLQTVEPEFVFLVACEAGTSVAVRDLFKSIASLGQVYGSPRYPLQEPGTTACSPHWDVAHGWQD